MTQRELLRLFPPRRHAPVYPSQRAELDAVRAGKKAMSVEVWPRDALPDDADYRRMLRLAEQRGLQVVHQPDAGRAGTPIVSVYVLRPEEAWRIPAHRALWQVFPAAEGAWSDGAEALEAHLLGYTPAQTAAHLADLRHRRLGWRGTTVHVVGELAVWCDDTRTVVRTPPAGVELRRTAVDDATFARVFPRPSRPIATGDARLLADARFEVLTRRGWVPAKPLARHTG